MKDECGMKDLTKILLWSSLEIGEEFGLYNVGVDYPGVGRFMGVVVMLLMPACLSLMAAVIEISKENK
jgi:hypothetical protein